MVLSIKSLNGLLCAAALALSALLVAGGTAAARPRSFAIVVVNGWSRPTPKGAPTAVGYLTVENHGRRPDELLGASSPAADQVQIHQTSNAGGIVRMRPVLTPLPIPPGGELQLGPEGYHLMLMGIRHQFRPGSHVPVILRFRHAGAMIVQLRIKSAPHHRAVHHHHHRHVVHHHRRRHRRHH